MKTYQSYKPSGVEWIGEIPSNWVVTKIKYVSEVITGNTPSKTDEDNYLDGKYLWIKPDGLNGFYPTNDCKEKISEKGLSETRIVPPLSVLINGIGNIGKFGYSELPVSTNQQLHSIVFSTNKVDKKYGLYLISSLTDEMNKNSEKVVISIYTKSKLERLEVILPSLHEQLLIVQFLDEKTELINKLISTKQRKITLLKEQRTSLINQVVTKGLNPNVKMKDSGVEWIGEIPEHWVTLGFTKIIKIRHGYQFREYDFTDEGIRIVKITQLDKDGYLNLDNCSFIDDKRVDEFERILIKENDVLMCLTGGTIGKIIKVGKVDEPLVQNYRVGHFSPLNDKIINDYVFWFMTSSLTTSQMFSEIRETGQPNIGMEDFGKMKVILPPLSEQIEIVKNLELKTKEIDDLIHLEQKKIDLLKEYRQSLISEVVTGKIKVTTDE